MANRTISKKECQGIREVFLLFDDDNSGHLAVKQVRSFLHPFVPDLSPCKLNGNIGLLDAEENAIVDFDDFYALVASLPIEYSKDALLLVWTMLIYAASQDAEIAQRAFSFYDKDNDKMITIEELRGFMRPATKAFGEDPSIAQLQEAIDAVDADGNKKVDFDEFKRLLTILEKRN